MLMSVIMKAEVLVWEAVLINEKLQATLLNFALIARVVAMLTQHSFHPIIPICLEYNGFLQPLPS